MLQYQFGILIRFENNLPSLNTMQERQNNYSVRHMVPLLFVWKLLHAFNYEETEEHGILCSSPAALELHSKRNILTAFSIIIIPPFADSLVSS